MISFQFGVSIFGVAATVAAFMLGLGGGALLAQRALARPSLARALRIFALLELAVALYALGLPLLNAAAGPALEALGARLLPWQWLTLQGACAVVLLALPAAAMGASFPVVLQALPPSDARLGRIYGLNCLGAAAGALLGLALLAGLGWTGALRVVAACGALVAAAAWSLGARARAAECEPAAPGLVASTEGASAVPRSLLLAYAGVGACGLILEVAWTRLYGMVLLRTEYVLAIILAVYLVGTALGSLLAARAGRHPWLTAAIPLVGCSATLLGVGVLPSMSVWLQQRNFDSLLGALALQSLALSVCTLPTTAALGAWLPLLARRLGAPPAAPGSRLDDARRPATGPVTEPVSGHAASLYGANCLGAAVGAVATVAIAIPWAGTTATICLAAVALLALGTSLASAPGPRRLLWLALPVAGAAGWLLHDFPEPQRMLPASAQVGRQLFRYEDALTLNHVTESADGQRTLLTDLQHMDASTEPAAVQIQADQARLPLLLHRSPRSILFLGLGTGISASGSLAYPQLERTAVELSPGAIAAARTWFAAANGGVLRSMQVDSDDARHYLAAQRRRYDVIVGDLFHPDLAGMSNLLSVEQFQRARDHLSADGIFAQWLALNQFDRESLRTVLRSFRQVFPDGVLFFDGLHLAMVGSPTRQSYGANVAAHLAGLPAAQIDAQTGGEGPWTWLGRYFGPVGGGIGPVQSEIRPIIEYRLPHLRYLEQAPLSELLLELLRQRPAPSAAGRQLAIGVQDQAAFADAYVATELAAQSWLASLNDDAERAGERMRLAFEANRRDRWIASALADELFDQAAAQQRLGDRAVLERILGIFPDHLEALRALWHLDRATGGAADRDRERLRALAPLDSEISAASGR